MDLKTQEQIAQRLGLPTERLAEFSIRFSAGKPPTVTAVYAPKDGALETVTKPIRVIDER